MKPVYTPTWSNYVSKKKTVKKKPTKKKTAKKVEMTVAFKSAWNSLSLHYVQAATRKEAIICAMQEEYCESERYCKGRYKMGGWSAFVFPGHIGETV